MRERGGGEQRERRREREKEREKDCPEATYCGVTANYILKIPGQLSKNRILQTHITYCEVTADHILDTWFHVAIFLILRAYQQIRDTASCTW